MSSAKFRLNSRDSGSETIVALDLLVSTHPRRSRASRPAKAGSLSPACETFADGKKLLYPLTSTVGVVDRRRRLHRCMVFLNFSILCRGNGGRDVVLALCGTHQPGPDSVHRRRPVFPKKRSCSHRNVVVSALQGRRWCSNFREGQEVFLGAVPLFHCYGLSTCQNLAVATGSPRIVLLPASKPTR